MPTDDTKHQPQPGADDAAQTAGRLRLVGHPAVNDEGSPRYRRRNALSGPAATQADEEGPASLGEPIESPTDPRWVLALRTAEALEGDMLPADKREPLLRIGGILGLRPFDAHLIIAIVQEQARRGFSPDYCPTAGEAELRLVPLPERRRSRGRQTLHTIAALAAFLVGEAFVLWWSLSAIL